MPEQPPKDRAYISEQQPWQRRPAHRTRRSLRSLPSDAEGKRQGRIRPDRSIHYRARCRRRARYAEWRDGRQDSGRQPSANRGRSRLRSLVPPKAHRSMSGERDRYRACLSAMNLVSPSGRHSGCRTFSLQGCDPGSNMAKSTFHCSSGRRLISAAIFDRLQHG